MKPWPILLVASLTLGCTTTELAIATGLVAGFGRAMDRRAGRPVRPIQPVITPSANPTALQQETVTVVAVEGSTAIVQRGPNQTFAVQLHVFDCGWIKPNRRYTSAWSYPNLVFLDDAWGACKARVTSQMLP